MSLATVIRAAARYVLKGDNSEVGVYHWQAREITLDAAPPQPVWIDGEEYGQTPITAKVLAKGTGGGCALGQNE